MQYSLAQSLDTPCQSLGLCLIEIENGQEKKKDVNHLLKTFLDFLLTQCFMDIRLPFPSLTLELCVPCWRTLILHKVY